MARSARSRLPFWAHQLAEYLIAAVLIASAWYSPEPAVQAVMGALIMANAALTDGPVGADAPVVVANRLRRRGRVGVVAPRRSATSSSLEYRCRIVVRDASWGREFAPP